MNPPEWKDAPRRLPRNVGTNHQSGVNNSTGSTSTTSDTYCEYSSPPSRNFYSKESEAEDEEDPELARKRKELQEIEERIMCKKVAIALKTVEPVAKKASPSFSCNDQSATCKGASLRDRVNAILEQRHSLIFLTKSAQEGKNSSSLSEGGVLLEDHPLKRRVNALMKQRCSGPCVLPTKVPDVTPLPPRQSVTSPAREESSVNKGFQRFLSVLNKGVDIDFLSEDPDVTPLPPSQSVASAAQKESSVDKGFQRFLSVLNKGVDINLLSRIVNDDSEDLSLGEELLNIQSPVVESKAYLPFRSESQQSNDRSLLPDSSRNRSGERKTDPPSQEQSHHENHSLPDEEEKNDRGHHCFGSISGSMSPPAVNNKKTEVKSKADEQREQLQNILNTLGLSLEVEEMSQLAVRTQQRLYGKKHEGRQKADKRQEQKSRPEGSHRHHSNSSSFSSSRLTSKSLSPSPSRYLRSHSRDLSGSQERGRASEHSHSGPANGDEVTCQDGIEAERHVGSDGKHSEEAFSYQHPQIQTYPSPHPPDFSAFPDYSLAKYSEHAAYHNGSDSGATDSYSTYTQDIIPSPLQPSRCPYPQSTSRHFPGPVMAPHMVFPYYHPFEDINFPGNPDLSKSEGQIGSTSRPRCLQVIGTKQSNIQSVLSKKSK
ncbi:hypothetical protein PAMA_015860 [Pampus argenteus]